MIALILIGVLVLTILVKYYFWKQHMESYVKDLPGLEGTLPVIGNAHEFVGKSTAEMFTEITSLVKRLDSPIKTWIGPMLTIIMDKPEDVKAILMSSNCLDKPYMYRFLPSDVGILTAKCKAFVWCNRKAK